MKAIVAAVIFATLSAPALAQQKQAPHLGGTKSAFAPYPAPPSAQKDKFVPATVSASAKPGITPDALFDVDGQGQVTVHWPLVKQHKADAGGTGTIARALLAVRAGVAK